MTRIDVYKKLYAENKDKLMMPAGRNYPLNYKIGLDWASQHCDMESNIFASQLVKHTVYVSFDEFISKLERACKSFKQYYACKKNVTYILIIPFNVNKSNLWVSLLSCPWISGIIHDIQFNITDAYNEYVISKKHKHVVCIICDDCAYTGNQINGVCSLQPILLNYKDKPKEPDPTSLDWVEWLKTITAETAVIEKTIDKNAFSVNLIIPYMSTLAQQTLSELTFVMVPSDIKVFKLFREHVNMHNYNQGLVREFETTFQYHTNISAIYFDHKIADAVSTFNKIYLLAPIFNCGSLRKSVCFIEGCCNTKDIDNTVDIYNIYINIEDHLKGNVCPKTFYKSIIYSVNGKHVHNASSTSVSDLLK
jgi:hypothetical protein